MTGADDTERDAIRHESLTAAERDLSSIRQILESAARGEAGGRDLKEAVQGYLDEHGPTLRAAAAAVGEEARRQALEELYKWRAQLNAQLGTREGVTRPSAPGS